MKNRLKNKRAIITGATSGIGLAIANELAEMSCNLILTGRRLNRLVDIQQKLQKHGVEVEIFAFDIRERAQCEEFNDKLSGEIDILVNNAGLALGFDKIYEANMDHWDVMIDTNVKGLLYISKLIIARMIKKNQGHVINIGSLAGHDAYAYGSGYCASKFAVKAINESMKKDVHATNIRVGMVSPGLVETEFSMVRFEGDKTKADKVYKGFKPLTADDIAEIVIFSLNRPDHVNILDSLVLPTAQSSSTMVDRSRS